jgi:hypothetical protein
MNTSNEQNNDDVNEFDKALTRALRPVAPPETLARFLAAAAEVEAERTLPRRERKHRWAWFVPQPHRWAFAAAAAALFVGIFAGGNVYQRHQREAEATRQFETATGITDQALQHTREQLAKAGVLLEQ